MISIEGESDQESFFNPYIGNISKYLIIAKN